MTDASRTLRFTVDRLDLETMTMKPHTVEIVGPTPPAMSADHIGEASNMVAPVEAVACPHDAWSVDSAGQQTHCVDCGCAHPAPIKTSADTGELRERVAELAWRFRGNERLGGPWYPGAKPTDSPAMSDCFGFADAILDLIQSERAGSPIGQND